MKYLRDTNICIELIRRQPINILNRLTARRVGDVGVSTITVAELQHGVAKSSHSEQNLAALEQFLLPLAIADFGYDAAVVYGQIRAQLEKRGTPIGSMNLLIAAHALSLDTILVTNNVKEFARVPRLKGEDWTKA
jgi:tRNA(fMet)-specific endonuclease VapC